MIDWQFSHFNDLTPPNCTKCWPSARTCSSSRRFRTPREHPAARPLTIPTYPMIDWQFSHFNDLTP
ncbi:hypothetical protein, partial [Morganella morganii]|uniref:hypothetical protein n=1 Tax=Morganella morganii TaxID=582 RepID=UPI00197BD38A